MLDLSLALFWMALVASILASVAYGTLTAAVSVSVLPLRGETSAGDMPVPSQQRSPRVHLPGIAATSLTLLTGLLLSGALGTRWAETGHIPLSNMYESTLSLAWGICFSYLAFERYTGVRRAGVIVLPIVLFFLAIASTFPSEPIPLIPALQNEPLMTIHVSAMVISFGVLTVAFAGAVIYLVQGGEKGRRFTWLPSGRMAEDLAHRAVLVGFPALGLGLALGAWWANSAWGRYWGWDPKETSALLVWLSLVAYFHARSGTGSIAAAPGIRRIIPAKWRRGWRPDPMWWLVIMFGLVLFTYFIVNLWVTGLHSYAGV